MSLAIYDERIDVEPVPAAAPGRRNVLLVGTILAIAAAAVMLGGVLGDYLHARDATKAAGDPWPPEGTTIPNVALFVSFIGLTLSSFFAQWAVSAIKLDDRRQAYMATSFTIALGLLFINGMTFSWQRLAQVAGDTPYATHMYAVTVTHVLFVVAAIAMWVVVAFRVYGGAFSPTNREPVVAATVVWHFVVVAGIVVWWTLWFLEGGPG